MRTNAKRCFRLQKIYYKAKKRLNAVFFLYSLRLTLKFVCVILFLNNIGEKVKACHDANVQRRNEKQNFGGGEQIVLCTDGFGWYQEEGKEARTLKPGDVVTIPANVKHWHGAAKDSWFSHIAIECPGENTSNEWLEPVSDEQYCAL